MSLDVYLTIKDVDNSGERIMIREDGGMREISRAECDERFPDREPIVTEVPEDEVFTANITHNLNTMASEAGIYKHLWLPDEINVIKANQLIEPLTQGLELLKGDPKRFKKHNPPNGWGDYEGLVEFTENYLEAA